MLFLKKSVFIQFWKYTTCVVVESSLKASSLVVAAGEGKGFAQNVCSLLKMSENLLFLQTKAYYF